MRLPTRLLFCSVAGTPHAFHTESRQVEGDQFEGVNGRGYTLLQG